MGLRIYFSKQFEDIYYQKYNQKCIKINPMNWYHFDSDMHNYNLNVKNKTYWLLYNGKFTNDNFDKIKFVLDNWIDGCITDVI